MNAKRKYTLIIFVLAFAITINAQKNEYLAGKIDYDKGLHNSAIEHLDKYISTRHNIDEAYFIRAKAKLKLFLYKGALEDLLEVNIKKFPEINLDLARIHAATNNKVKAIIHLKHYLKLKTKLPEEQVIAFPEFGNIADSQEWEIVWETKWYSRKENLLQEAEFELKLENHQAAETLLNEYVVRYKANSYVFFLKAKLSMIRANYRDAISYLDKALELEKKTHYLISRAQAEFKLKKYKKSIKTFDEALQKDSLNLEIRFGRSLVYSALKKHELAEADIKKYLNYYPAKVEGIERLAEIQNVSGDFLAAIQTYGKLINNYPVKAKYYKARANAYMSTRTYKYAIIDYSMSLDLYPRDAEVYLQKGNAHYKLKETKKACKSWKQAQNNGSMQSQKLIYKHCR